MGIKLFKLYNKVDFMLLFSCSIMIPIFLVDMSYTETLFNANYIALVCNNILLIILYKKIEVINKTKEFILCRKTTKKCRGSTSFFCMLTSVLYLIGLYMTVFLISRPIEIHEFVMLLKIIPLNTIVFVIETIIISLQFDRKTNIVFIILPLVINMCFHYFFFF